MLKEFTIAPVLGRKADVPQNDPTLFKEIAGVIATHDVGGKNYDLTRKRHSCTKTQGFAEWSNSANAQATKCLGLCQLYDGTNRDNIFVDNGVVYIYDSNEDPVAYTNLILPFDAGNNEPTIGETISENGGDASGVLARYEVTSGTWAASDAAGNLYLSTSTGTWSDNTQLDGDTTGANVGTSDIPTGTSSTTFATDNVDLCSMTKVGDYWVFSDRGESIPHKWKNGDSYLTPLDATGGEDGVGGECGAGYRFRYLVNFARRVVGLYCINDTDAPEISVRYSTAWPGTSIANLNFPAANQLYIPNDDKIVGGMSMGTSLCPIYCENSINVLSYYADYEKPFRIYTPIQGQGIVNHHCIVPVGNTHYVFNKNYGFCIYAGGEFPHGGKPISMDIETEISGINQDYQNLIVGTYDAANKKIIWTVPANGSTTPNQLWEYDLYTGMWQIREYAARFVDTWSIYPSATWSDLAASLGASTSLWSAAGTNIWTYYTSSADKLMIANTDGKLYSEGGETFATGTNDGYRIEPILDFGDAKRKETLQEIWFDLNTSTDCRIHIWYRGGDTVGEVVNASWDEFFDADEHRLSHNSPNKAAIFVRKTNRLHQIKWGTNNDNELFQVNRITFRYIEQTEN